MLRRRNRSSSSHPDCSPASERFAQRESSERFRTALSDAVIISTNGSRMALEEVSLPLGQQLQQLREDFFAILPFEGEGELGVEQAELHADVVAASGNLQSQATLPLGEPDQRGGQ